MANVLEAKADLENDIRTAVQHFQTVTGLVVDDIRIESIQVSEADRTEMLTGRVDVIVRL